MLHWLSHLASPGNQEVFWTVAISTLSKHHPHLLRDSFPGGILRSGLLDISRGVKFHADQVGAVEGMPGPQKRGSANLPGSHFYRWQWTCHHANYDKSDDHCQPGGLVWFFPLCVECLSVAVWIVWRCCWCGGDGLSGSTLRLKEKHPGEQQSWGLGGDGAAELNLPLWQSWL